MSSSATTYPKTANAVLARASRSRRHDAALFVDPLDQASLAGAMQSALSDATLRERLQQAGLKRAADFSSEKTAKKTLGVYQGLLGIEADSANTLYATRRVWNL